MEEIEKLLSRPRAYYNIDGVGELGVGFLFLGYALSKWMLMHTPGESVWHQPYMWVIYLGVTILIIHYGSKAFKKHITYPRTGFVQYRRSTRWRGFAGAMVGGVAGTALLWILRAHGGLTTLASLYGFFFAGGYAYGVARKVRWKWTVVCAMALGSLAIARFPATALGAFWNTMALYGTLLMISGAISFILYLRHTQAPEQDTQ